MEPPVMRRSAGGDRGKAEIMVSSARTSKPLGETGADDARIEREDVGGEGRIVAVDEGAGDRRAVQQVLDIDLDLEPRPWPGEGHAQVDVGPGAQLVDRILIDPRPRRRLMIDIAMQRPQPAPGQ